VSVAIDTMVIIFGLRTARKGRGRAADKAITELRRRANVLISTLAENRETVIVPSIVVAELLAGIPTKDHGNFLSELQERFFIVPFDVRASQVAAQLWQKHRGLPKEAQIARSTLKADAMIVASAFIAGATVFYTHQAKVRNLAELAGMSGRDLPTHSENLFIDAESRKAVDDVSEEHE
jgi:predicted nucleic acid-binding protein